jgi:2,3-dihydroxybenzoate-AMP ligase
MSAARTDGFVPWPEEVAARYRSLGLWRGLSLWAQLQLLAERHQDRIALVDARQRVSYAALAQRAEALAGGLFALGVRPGDAVVVQLPNCVELIELYFALFRLGARPVAAQLAHRRLELTHCAQKTRAVAHVICDQRERFDFRALAQELRASCASLRHTIVLGEPHPGQVALHALREPAERALPEAPAAHEVALFQLSGGSTDVPKLIARTHDDYLYSVRRSVEVCGLDEHTVYLAALPAAHNFPLSSPGVLGALLAGGRVVLIEQASPDLAFPWIEREGVTITALVPALLPAWLSAAARRGSSLATLSLLQIGGAKLHEALARRVEPELGCRLQQVFGMAEGLVCYTRLDDPLERVVSTQGRPMSPYDELRVVDEHDRELAAGETGDLLTRGPYTIRGYFAAPEHDARAFTSDGFYRTGDRVRMLPDGSLVVEGRSKDQINRGGEKIAAPEVEAQLCAHPAVEAAAVVAMPDPYLGERSCAFVVARAEISAKELVAYLKQRGLAAYKIPDRIELTAALPQTAVGKVDKQALRARAATR